MTGHEIRSLFLRFFEERGHRVVKSSPLLPANDPTLLFANAGMNQFKDVFTGAEKRDYARAVSSQKCVRAGGKHNDLDEVGKTARHHTFFEMLGNFSFGDYFKEDGIRFAWDLLVNEMKLDVDRLWFSVYEGSDTVPADDEAAALWEKVGAPKDHILRFGAKDNFWQMGDTGPCGPCSEIHYFMGDDPADNRAEFVNGPGDTIMEIWNLVFMQYERFADGTLTPLPAPSVDTGMGLERIACVLQGVKSNYETDLIKPIIEFVADRAKKHYDYDTDEGMSMRVIADHARAASFLIADGIFPGNEGRAYVLRKIMRRALWHGRLLGMETPFFDKVCDFVVDHMKGPFPELDSSRQSIARVVSTEERGFATTLSTGLRRLEELLESTGGELPAYVDLAKLYDTYGLRSDLIGYVLETKGIAFDEAAFRAALRTLQQTPGEGAKGHSKEVRTVYRSLEDENLRSEFRGYDEIETAGARVTALVAGDERVNELAAGQEGELVLDRTPFYAEAGGQVGDVGRIEGDEASLAVLDTRAPVQGVHVHKVRVEQGTVRVGDAVTARVDAEKRRRTRANHTATHLLHKALKEVLGPHVKQGGSLVAPDRLRFDFTHFAPLTDDEIAEIERIVNAEILRNQALRTEVHDLEAAIASGAVALFGEKYGERVRVVSVPGFSTELCGGTHVTATGDIGLFKLIGDASIASGVRRIEALTADGAFERYQKDEAVLGALAQRFRTVPQEVPAQVDQLSDKLRRLEREVEALRLKLATQQMGSAAESAREVRGIKILTQRVSDLDDNQMRQTADQHSQKLRSGVVVLGRAADGKAAIVVRVTDDLTKRVHAGKLVNELASIVGGRGGGRPDMAMAGGKEPEKLDAALEAAYSAVDRLAASVS
jgi:alanyl-tRNA synthetase